MSLASLLRGIPRRPAPPPASIWYLLPEPRLPALPADAWGVTDLVIHLADSGAALYGAEDAGAVRAQIERVVRAVREERGVPETVRLWLAVWCYGSDQELFAHYDTGRWRSFLGRVRAVALAGQELGVRGLLFDDGWLDDEGRAWVGRRIPRDRGRSLAEALAPLELGTYVLVEDAIELSGWRRFWREAFAVRGGRVLCEDSYLVTDDYGRGPELARSALGPGVAAVPGVWLGQRRMARREEWPGELRRALAATGAVWVYDHAFLLGEEAAAAAFRRATGGVRR